MPRERFKAVLGIARLNVGENVMRSFFGGFGCFPASLSSAFPIRFFDDEVRLASARMIFKAVEGLVTGADWQAETPQKKTLPFGRVFERML